MNRKGFINLTYIFVVLIVIIALVMAQTGIGSESEEQLINSLNWTRVGANLSASMQNNIDNASEEWIAVVLSIVQKAVDFFGYAIFELGKLAAKIAIDNPDIINYKTLFILVLLSLLAPLIYPSFIIIVSLILIIKEWYVNRREAKALEAMKK